jgi:hypothetical protein
MRPGNNQAAVIAASALAFAAITAATPRPAAADSTGTVVVTGKLAARERTVIESAITTALRRASWTMSVQPFTPKETETISKCLANDHPWPCLAPLVQPKGVDRIIVAEVKPQPDSPSKLVITGEFAVAGDNPAAVMIQRCDGCDDARLAAAARRLTEDLLRDMAAGGETVLALQTVPAGASVVMDDQSIGITDGSGKLSQTTLPGPHKLTVRHPGFVDGNRTIELPVARTTPLAIELAPAATTTEHPLLVPLAFVGAGAAAVIVGGVLIYVGQQDGPNDPTRYTRATPIGVVTGVVGLAAIGYGAYLLWRGPTSSGLTLNPTPGGLVAGWAGGF